MSDPISAGDDLTLSEQPARFQPDDPAEADRLATEVDRDETERPPQE